MIGVRIAATHAGKRPLDSVDDASPTRKAQKTDEAPVGCDRGGGFDDHLASIRANIHAIASIDDLSNAQLDALAEVRDRISELVGDEVEDEEDGEDDEERLFDEVLLPKDLLCIAFKFLPPANLAAAAQACHHFDEVVQSVVEQRIRGLFDDKFSPVDTRRDLRGRNAVASMDLAAVRGRSMREQCCGDFTAHLLHVLEDELRRSAVLIDMLNDSMKDEGGIICDAAMDIKEELAGFHTHVLRARMPQLISKIRDLIASPDRGEKLRDLRTELWDLICRCIDKYAIHRDERSAVLTDSIAEVLAQDLQQGVFGAWQCLVEMPSSFIESQAALIFEQLTSQGQVYRQESGTAFELLEKLPSDALVRISTGSHLAVFLERSDILRHEKKAAQRILATLECP